MSKRSILVFSVALTAIVFAIPFAAMADTGEKTDEDMIHERAMEFVSAWNENDPSAMSMLWTEDGDFVNPFGRIAQGREKIEKLFAEDLEGMLKGTAYSMTLKWVRMIKPDVAVATWDGTVTGVTGPGDTPLPDLEHVVTAVTVKIDDKWWTVAARVMAPMKLGPPPPKPPPGK